VFELLHKQEAIVHQLELLRLQEVQITAHLDHQVLEEAVVILRPQEAVVAVVAHQEVADVLVAVEEEVKN
jgi:hypothetical protein